VELLRFFDRASADGTSPALEAVTATPDETVPDETVPDETVPDETVPDETVPVTSVAVPDARRAWDDEVMAAAEPPVRDGS
jgi:hypothetical protein